MDEPSLFHFFEYFSKYKLLNYIHLHPYPLRTFNILTQSLRFLCNYASLRNAELVRKEEALYLRFFTQELKMRKFAICNGPGRWTRSKLIFRISALCDVGLSVHEICIESSCKRRHVSCSDRSII